MSRLSYQNSYKWLGGGTETLFSATNLMDKFVFQIVYITYINCNKVRSLKT